jgi:hypothetical protein
MRRLVRRILSALLGAGLLLPGAAAPGAEPVRSLLEMRRDRVVVQEWDLSCGAAALATVLNHQHGDMIGERDVALGLIGQERYIANPQLVRLRHGFSLLDLKRFVDGRGYTGIGFGGLDLDSLTERAPAIVPIRTVGYNHFVVYRGRMGNRVLLADPAFGTRTMTIAKFQRSWLTYPVVGRVAFIVGRGDGPAPPGDLAPRAADFRTLR